MTAPPNSLAFADNMALRIFVLLLCLFAASLPLVSAKCLKKFHNSFTVLLLFAQAFLGTILCRIQAYPILNAKEAGS